MLRLRFPLRYRLAGDLVSDADRSAASSLAQSLTPVFPPFRMSRISCHLLLVLLLSAAAQAGEGMARPTVLRLTLEKALELALAKNFSIEVQRFSPKIAQEAIRAELGRFDPRLELSATTGETTRRDIFENGLRLETKPTTQRLDQLSGGIAGVTSWGTEYDLGYTTQRRTGSDILFDTPYESTAGLGLRQPLLRNAGPSVNLAQVRIARNNVRVSEWQLRDRVIEVMTTLSYVFNDLQLAIENRAVAERSRELARTLLGDNEKREAFGALAKLDVTTARAQVASREEGVILAERNVLDNENLLKQLTTRDILQMLDVRVEIEPPESPKFEANVLGGVRDALALRPDYRQALLELERRHITVVLQKNQTLPRIDLTGSLDLLGLDTDYATSVGRIGRRDNREWTAGVLFSIPLGNRAAHANLSAARLEVARSLVALQQLEQQIVVDVDNASGQIVTSRQRIASTVEARRLARESLSAGEERLRAGTGTTFEVLELQEKLATSEYAELLARSDYNKAVAEYHRQTGTSLRVHGVAMK